MPKKSEFENQIDSEVELRYVQTLLVHAELKLKELRETGLPRAGKDDPECLDEVRRLVKHAEVFTVGACHKVNDALRAMADPEFVRSAGKVRVRDFEDRLERLLEEFNSISS